MTRYNIGLFSLSCLLAAPLMAQTTIGGGTCNSASLNGAYALNISGRQVTASGNFTGAFQANGTATFDGLNKVSVTLVSDTNQAVGTPLTWSGTYSIQANCEGATTITTGGSATLNLLLYNGGTNFLLTGSDSTYSYSGSGNTQGATCSASSFSGVYIFSGTGFAIASNAVAGVENGTGLLQFDGQGNVTLNATMSATGVTPPAQLTLTGSYSVSANCLGSATLTDSKANSYVMSFSVYTATAVSDSAFFMALGQSGKFIITGNGHAAYGQPTAALFSASAHRGGRA